MSASEHSPPMPEFSRSYSARSLPGQPVRLNATEEECSLLAKRFGIESLDSMSAELDLAPKDTGVIAKGTLAASLTQICAVSGNPFPTSISAAIDLVFSEDWDTPPGCAATDADTEETGFALSDDVLDLMPLATNGQFDLGEAVAQSLALELDPYPEGPEAEALRAQGALDEPQRESPFAALKALKSK